MKNVIWLTAVVSLSACSAQVSGQIGAACMAANRDAATPALCSCVQQVANQTLNSSDQSRAVAFFEDPDLAQSTRQADGRANEAFWDRYTAFADAARRSCG